MCRYDGKAIERHVLYCCIVVPVARALPANGKLPTYRYHDLGDKVLMTETLSLSASEKQVWRIGEHEGIPRFGGWVNVLCCIVRLDVICSVWMKKRGRFTGCALGWDGIGESDAAAAC